jgi:DNA polymerase sigma
MENDTTTDAGNSEAGAIAEPEQTTQQTAATQPAEPKTTDDQGPAPQGDDNLDWLQKKGIDPQSPEALSKIAEMYRNAERKMHESTAKASNLESTITDAAQNADIVQEEPTTELAQRLQALELKDKVNTFFSQDGIDPEMRPRMAEYAQKNPNVAYLVENGYMTVQDLYNMTRGGDDGLLTKAKQDGGREALQKVADKQQAKAISGHAVSSSLEGTVTKDNFDEWYSGLSSADRARPENQAIVNSVLSS